MKRSASEFHGKSIEDAHLFLNNKLSANLIAQQDYDIIVRFLNYKISFGDMEPVQPIEENINRYCMTT